MKRIKLTVAYDGTNYHGWQVQPNADTIEGELNKAISELTGEQIEVIGASRTDAGVHALGNVAVFDTESRIPGEKISYALNQRLPDDIIIQKSEEVDRDFHPRYQECRKTYEYTILNRRFPLPEYRNTAHFDYGNLDIEAMKKACKAFIGEHDFAAFKSSGTSSKSSVRTIYNAEVVENNGRIIIKLTGNGFLYNMVRIISGTLLEVGQGTIKPEEIEKIIQEKDRKKAGKTLPPQGLYLVKVEYA